jgi:hypothetical protein
MRQLSPINATGTLSTRRSSWAADARFRAFDLDSQVPASGRPAPAGDRRPRSALRCGADGQAGNVGHGSHRRRRASAAQWSRPAISCRWQRAALWHLARFGSDCDRMRSHHGATPSPTRREGRDSTLAQTKGRVDWNLNGLRINSRSRHHRCAGRIRRIGCRSVGR